VRRLCLALALLAWAARSPALSTATGPLGLGAAALGAGGAVVATVEGAPALDWNPAGLGVAGWDLGYDLGQGGPTGSTQQGLALASALDDTVAGGLRFSDQAFAGGYHEAWAGLGVAAHAGSWLSAGMVQKLMLAEPGGLRGWSMDAGLALDAPLGGGWRLRLGAAATDLASSLAWANGLEEVQPSVLRYGAALQMAPGTWLALQQDHLDRQGNGGLDQWRAGAQASFWGQAVALRVGATQASGGDLYATGGVGLSLPWPGQRASVDYGVMVPVDPGPGSALRQLGSLTWRFGQPIAPPQTRARLAQALTDKQGRLHLARISISQAPRDASAWRVEVKDRSGRTVKVFAGKGHVPASLVWDGRDALGDPVEAAGLSYELRGNAAGGTEFHQRELLAPAAAGDLGGPQPVGDAGGWGLRGGPAAASAARPKVQLKGGGDLAVSSADFDVAAVAGADPQGWELRIVDAGGRTVKTIQGRGRPPKAVHWEGTDDLGQPVEGSLGASYEIRVTNAEGQQRVAAAAPVVSSAGFADLAERARLHAPPASGWHRDRASGEVRCVLYFADGSARLGAQAERALVEALAAAGRAGDRRVAVIGFAEPWDGGATRAQARADAVLRRLVDQGRLSLRDATVEGQSQAGRAGRVELSVGGPGGLP
jgi:hypothetical protein